MKWFLLCVVAYIAFRAQRSVRSTRESRDRALDAWGLRELDVRLRSEVIDSGGRPGDPRLFVVDVMCALLHEWQAAQARPGHAGVVEPPDEQTRLACVELVRMGKMIPLPDGKSYAFATISGAPAR